MNGLELVLVTFAASILGLPALVMIVLKLDELIGKVVKYMQS